jgi:hypothetical protein
MGVSGWRVLGGDRGRLIFFYEPNSSMVTPGAPGMALAIPIA